MHRSWKTKSWLFKTMARTFLSATPLLYCMYPYLGLFSALSLTAFCNLLYILCTKPRRRIPFHFFSVSAPIAEARSDSYVHLFLLLRLIIFLQSAHAKVKILWAMHSQGSADLKVPVITCSQCSLKLPLYKNQLQAYCNLFDAKSFSFLTHPFICIDIYSALPCTNFSLSPTLKSPRKTNSRYSNPVVSCSRFFKIFYAKRQSHYYKWASKLILS